MASDDVIELGSSDEETEPAPKKKKPPPNAMVHIPNKLHGITIKPSKSNTKINPECIINGSIGKSVTVTKIPKSNINPFANNMRKPVRGLVVGKAPSAVKHHVQIPIQKRKFVPVNNKPILINSLLNTGMSSFSRTGIKTHGRGNPINPVGMNTRNLVKVLAPEVSLSVNSDAVPQQQNPKHFSNLPPGITVKRSVPSNFKLNTNMKRLKMTPTALQMSKTGTITTRTKSNDVLTVDLDDEEPATSSAFGPQWYLRPEEQEKQKSHQKSPDMSPDSLEDKLQKNKTENTPDADVKSPEKSLSKSPNKASEKSPEATQSSGLEQQNNKEPDKTTYIEITIEDSPIKPDHTKKGFKVGAELAITIEDSPVKNITESHVSSNNSDSEKSVSPKDRNSKKKLEYPKTIEMVETVEIEFEPLSVEKSTNSSQKKSISSDTEDKNEKLKPNVECIDIMEIEESPVKPAEVQTPNKSKQAKPEYKMTQIDTVVLDDTEKDEFNPIYQSFINLCFQLENSEDMKKIVEKKIKSYYRQVPKEYTDSETFTDMVSSKIVAMKAGPEKMYLYIKDIVDELNLQRKMAKAQPPVKETKNEEQEKFLYGEKSEFDGKRQRQIRKLEKTLKKLHRAIQKLEEQEVDFDDEEDSVYLLTESEDDTSSKDDKPLNKEVLLQRYKERMVRVHAKLCQLTNTKMPSEARVQIDARPGQSRGPAKRLEKWINRKVPIGTPMPFPDFHDVLRCVRDANQEEKLGWNEADIMDEARDLFTRCGKKLQRRRQENEWRLAASRIPVDVVDPAEDSVDLKRKLEENKRMAAKKETEVFNKYADRQKQLKLEAIEIGDKEAEESPVESDDEVEETDFLINKKKRKECLKRLLQEKSKKAINEKENHPDQPADKSSENQATKNSNETRNTTIDTDEQGDAEIKNKDSPTTDLPDKNPLISDLPDKNPLISDLPDKNSVESNSDSESKDNNKEHCDKVHSLSDDSNRIESDIDELHLLQKLYSENELNTSVMDSSDSGSPIAISDTSSINDKTSSDDRLTKKQSSDVISIENSSYSESEENKGESTKDTEADKKVIEETVDVTTELECSNNGVEKKNNKTNNEEYNGCLEDMLLASSDEGNDSDFRKDNDPDDETSINLRDDTISIGETVIEESWRQDNRSDGGSTVVIADKNGNTDSSSVEGMEIGPSEIISKDQNGLDIVETTSVKSTDEESITEITSVKSLEASEEDNAVEITSIKSVESIEGGNANKTTNVDSVETIEEDTTIENIEVLSKNKKIASVDIIGDDAVIVNSGVSSKNKEEVAPVETILDTIMENSGVSFKNKKQFASADQIEDDEEIENNGISSKNKKEVVCVETIEDNTMIENSGVSSENKKEVSSVKTIEVDTMIENNGVSSKNIKQVASVDTIEDDQLIDNSRDLSKSKKEVASVAIIEDDTMIKNNRGSSNNENEIVINVTENTDAGNESETVETKQNDNSVPELMEVDSNLG